MARSLARLVLARKQTPDGLGQFIGSRDNGKASSILMLTTDEQDQMANHRP